METVNLEVTRGDTKTYVVTLTDENGTVINITGWTIFFTVKNSIEDLDSAALISKTITSHTDPTHGQTKISLSTTDTARLGEYVYDIQVKKDTGDILTPLIGQISFLEDVTQRVA